MSLKDKLIELAESKKEDIEAKKAVDFWRSQADKLYSDIKTWFFKYTEDGYIKFDSTKEIIDEYPSPYEIDKLELDIKGGPEVILEPVGSNIIGAWGRIDVYLSGYIANKVMLLLMKDDNEKAYWELRKSRKEEDRFVFNKEIFEDLLEDWLNNPPDFI